LDKLNVNEHITFGWAREETKMNKLHIRNNTTFCIDATGFLKFKLIRLCESIIH